MNTELLISSTKKRKAWRFWVPLMIQAVLIVSVPLQSAVIYTTGKAVTLKTAPVDPYDFLRGYSQILRYEISNPETLSKIDGGDQIFEDSYQPEEEIVFVTLQAPETEANTNAAWEPVKVSRDRPQQLANNEVVLKGIYQGRRIKYGLETYYMPEKQRDQINEEIREVRQDEDQAFLVDIKVNDKGKGVPISLWVGDRKYQF